MQVWSNISLMINSQQNGANLYYSADEPSMGFIPYLENSTDARALTTTTKAKKQR